MIRPASDIVSYTIPSDGLTALVAHEQGSNAERIMFIRYKRRYGIIVITAYQRTNLTKCECAINDAVCERWYYHAISTNRQAALMANRLLADLEKEKE